MATKIKFNFKKAKFKIAWLKALKVIFGLELQTAKIAVDSGEFYYTLRDDVLNLIQIVGLTQSILMKLNLQEILIERRYLKKIE